MSGLNGLHPLQAPAVDSLFVQLVEGNGASRPTPPREPEPAQWSPAGWSDPPADLEKVPELREAYRWLQGERRRLEEYTRTQFAAIQQRHQQILAQHFRNEESLALRTQELNREMTFLAAQAKIIQERAAELAQREKALAEQEALQRAHPHSAAPLPDKADRPETNGTAPNELAEVAHALKEHQEVWESKQAAIADRLAQMEQRYQALDQAEEAARRRMAELDELENRLMQEFEKQERQLALERRQIETLRLKGMKDEG
jgi:hypothetical protein